MLSAYENGHEQPSLVTLGRLLTALDADLVDLQAALDLQRLVSGPTQRSEHRDRNGSG